MTDNSGHIFSVNLTEMEAPDIHLNIYLSCKLDVSLSCSLQFTSHNYIVFGTNHMPNKVSRGI